MQRIIDRVVSFWKDPYQSARSDRAPPLPTPKPKPNPTPKPEPTEAAPKGYFKSLFSTPP